MLAPPKPPAGAEAGKAKAAGGGGTSDEEDAEEGEGGPDDGAVPCESKLRALMAELRAMREADPTAKALVFTQ